MSRRPSTCQRIRQRIRQGSLRFAAPIAALAAALAPQAPARADLSWFDVAVSEDRPHVSLADVVAWSDACLDIKAEEWPAVERVYADYIARWSGEGNDEEKLWQGLASVLGGGRSGCLDAFRSSTDLVLRTRDSSNRHVAVRRELLALAATRGQFADDARRIAREISGRVAPVIEERSPTEYDQAPPIGEAAAVRNAIMPVRANLAAVVGEARADAVLANIVQAYEISGTTALSPEFRAIIENATRFSSDERARLAAAYAAADAKLVARTAIDKPRETRTEADDALFKEIESILGADRADLIRALAGGYVDVRAYPEAPTGPKPNTPLPDLVNSAADALLARYVDPKDFAAVASVAGRRFWRPLSHHGMRTETGPVLAPMDAPFLAAVAGAKGEDELAVVEAIQSDYAIRFAQAEHATGQIMAKEARLVAIAETLVAEDERAFRELQSAFGAERVGAQTIALARFARLERTLPFAKVAVRFDTMNRIPWPSGSVAGAFFGQVAEGVTPLPASRSAALRAALAESADALLAGRLAAWRELAAASASFDRVMEQFAGQSRVARERLVAMQAARLAGLAACASAARRSYGDAISLVERLAGEGRVFDAQFVALALIRQDLGGTDAGRRLMDELDRIASAESRDRALAALVPATPGAAEVLRASSDAAMAAGDMDDGDLGRIQAGNAVLGALKDTRRRLDRAMRAQVAVAWRTLRDAGDPAAATAFRP